MPPDTPHREVFLHLAPWMRYVFYLSAGLATAIFLYGFYRRLAKYRKGRSVNRFDDLPGRILKACGTILTNATVRQGDGLGGLAHTLILWGFIILLIGTAMVAVDYDLLEPLGYKLLKGRFYLGFSAVLDVFGLLFIVGLVMMMFRRFRGLRELDYTRADHQEGAVDRSAYVADDWIFLWLLLLIAVSGFLVEGLRIAEKMPAHEKWSPVGWAIASAIQGASDSRLIACHIWAWWGHALLVMLFIAYIPFSKMMHVMTDIANLVFRDERPARELPPPPEGKPGYAAITDFTWKELLDLDACTKCGRCHVACPAHAAGTTLSPRDMILDLRGFANETFNTPEWLTQRFGNGSPWSGASPLEVDVATQVIRPETLWSCTTCLACVEVCPVGIEHLTHIVQMRRQLVDQGTVGDNLQGALISLGDYGNSFGASAKKRAKWTKKIKPKLKDARKEAVEYLWFVGDFASYDPRMQEKSVMVAEVFNRAGLDFGILYDGERNAGNDVRRAGEEGLFEMLAEENIKALEKATFKEIVTTDPHTLNALRNEYPALGGSYTVHHYTALISRLIADGKLSIPSKLQHKVTYHDPCYLARYNGEVEAPRALLAQLGLQLVDMPRCGANTFCCGAGGGRIWMDTSNETQRTSEQRIEEALALGDDIRYFVTACPKDYAMYTDAVKSLGVEQRLPVKDVIELVLEALGQAEPDGEPAQE